MPMQFPPRVQCAAAHIRTALIAGAWLAVTACTPPPDAPTEQPVEPQATHLRDAIRAPVERASATQQTVDDAAARQRQAVEDAGG